MNLWLLVSLFISTAWAGAIAPGCADLPIILLNYESDLMKQGIAKCSDLDLAKLTMVSMTSDQNNYFNTHKCSTLDTIENELRTLENQHALLTGFEKLKAEISVSKQRAADPNILLARAAGRKFSSALNTAQSLDMLLVSTNDKGEGFVEKLKAIPEAQRNNPAKFQAAVQALCVGKTDHPNNSACSPKFKPSVETVEDLNLLLLQKTDAESLTAWRNSLSIQKKDGSPYSFSLMAQDFSDGLEKLGSNSPVLSREQLKIIQALPEFENASKLVPGLKNKSETDALISGNKFKFLVEDLMHRQALEMTSKISVMSLSFKNLLSQEDQVRCANAKHGLSSAYSCLEAFDKYLKDRPINGDQLNRLSKLLNSTNVAKDYHNELIKISQTCMNENLTNELSLDCQQKLNLDQEVISGKILALNILKEKIGKANEDKMVFRNFAMKKMVKNCKDMSAQSIVGDCDEQFQDQISREAISLTSSITELAGMYHPKDQDEEKAKALCESKPENKKSTDEKKLCLFFTTSVPDELPLKKVNEDEYNAPVVAPDGGNNSTRDAWVKGLSAMTNDIVGQWARGQNRPTTPYNPYNYNYSPYSGPPMMGISDSILFNARYHGGYGYYMPTLGYQPYTAFGAAPMTQYTPYTSAKSAYFTVR